MKNKIIFIVIFIFSLIISFFIINKDYNYDDIVLLINNKEKISIENDSVDVDSLSTNIKIKNLSNKTIYINNKKVLNNKSISLKLDKLGKPIKVRYKLKKYYINTIPSDFPKYKTTGKSSTNGNYYIVSYNSINNNKYMYELDSSGNLIYYKRTDNIIANYKKIKTDKVRYTYIELPEEHNQNNNNHYDFVILDENHNEIDRVNYNDEYGVDIHDAIYINDGHYIIAVQIDKEVNNFPEEIYGKNNMIVQDAIIAEVKNGEILWQFDSIDYDYFYKYYNPSNVIEPDVSEDYYGNYMHFNSMTIDPKDGNLLVSFRNICEIVKIDRSTGKVIWQMGGKGDEFGLTKDQKFYYQHNISFIDNNILLLYDNGYKGRNSRIAIIKYDEENKKILDYKNYSFDVITTNWGFVEHLKDDNYLVNYGMNEKIDRNVIDEINIKTGKINFSIDFDTSQTYFFYKDSEVE